VKDIQVFNNNKMMAACSNDLTVKIFDISELSLKEPKLIQTITTKHMSVDDLLSNDGVLSISISSDNFLLASAGADK